MTSPEKPHVHEARVQLDRSPGEMMVGCPDCIARNEERAADKERIRVLEADVFDAHGQLLYWWDAHRSCPCGALAAFQTFEKGNPEMRWVLLEPHSIGCPTAKAIEWRSAALQEKQDA